MYARLLTVSIIAALAAGPVVAADNASRQETIGVGVGATVGALAGGPVGLVIGAAVGAKLGDQFYRKDLEVKTLDSSLKASRGRISELEQNAESLTSAIDRLDRELQQTHAKSRPELLNLLQSGIEMDLLFRTGEHDLPESTNIKLGQLAASLAAMPDIYLRLDGFADERGDSRYNHNLSVQRAEFVSRVLQENGVPGERIELSAHGESPATDDSADSYALERRVSVTIYVPDSPSLAANPEIRH